MGIIIAEKNSIIEVWKKMEVIMNLLSYTRKIAEKINFYDEIAKNALSDFAIANPFIPQPPQQPVNITIIWIDGENESWLN